MTSTSNGERKMTEQTEMQIETPNSIWEHAALTILRRIDEALESDNPRAAIASLYIKTRGEVIKHHVSASKMSALLTENREIGKLIAKLLTK